MLKWSIFGIYNKPFWLLRLLYATLQQNDCTSSKFFITLWPWVKVKVIQTHIKRWRLVISIIVPALNISIQFATLPGAWHYIVSTRTGWPTVSTLTGWNRIFISPNSVSVQQHAKIAQADPWSLSNQETTFCLRAKHEFLFVCFYNNNNHIQRCDLRFLTISSLRHKLSPTHSHVVWAQSCANHMQHIKRLSRATCRVTCHMVCRAHTHNLRHLR